MSGRRLATTQFVASSGTAHTPAFVTLDTATVGKCETIILKSLVMNLRDNAGAASGVNYAYGLTIGTQVILAGQVLALDGTSKYFVTTSGGSDPRNLIAMTRDASGLILVKPDLTAGFFNTTSKTPKAFLESGITGLTAPIMNAAQSMDFSGGVIFPLMFQDGDLLRAFISCDANDAGSAYLYVTITAEIVADSKT